MTKVVEPQSTVSNATPVPPKKPNKKLPALYQGRQWSQDMPIPYTPIRSEDVTFGQVVDVMTSWSKVAQIPNYLSVAGELLLRK